MVARRVGNAGDDLAVTLDEETVLDRPDGRSLTLDRADHVAHVPPGRSTAAAGPGNGAAHSRRPFLRSLRSLRTSQRLRRRVEVGVGVRLADALALERAVINELLDPTPEGRL